jgi:hypothetical protein
MSGISDVVRCTSRVALQLEQPSLELILRV